MDVNSFNWALLAGLTILLVGVIGARVAALTSVPALLVFLGLGVVIGEAGLGLQFSDASLTQALGLLALAVILASGGLSTRWSDIRPAVGIAAVLATVGVFVSVTLVAVAASLFLGFDTRTAILMGAIVSSTDAAAVFSILRRVPLARRPAAILEAESGFNDPPVVVLVALVTSPAWGSQSWPVTLAMIALQLAGGLLIGLAAGALGEQLLRRLALPAVGLYPITVFAITMLAYAAGSVLQVSGLLAVYVSSLWLGNTGLPHRRGVSAFADGLGWLAQIGLFVMLGLLSSPSRLPEAIGPALVIGSFLLLVARPVSVILCATPFRIPWREQAFMSIAGLRGAVPIVVATIPVSAGLFGTAYLFDVVFVLVVVFTAIQGPLIPPAARALQVTVGGPTTIEIDAAPLDEVHGDIITTVVPPGSRLRGVDIRDLGLPNGALVSLVVRAGQPIVPDTLTRLKTHDRIVIVCLPGTRDTVEQRLRDLDAHGRLAGWITRRTGEGT
ncbi:MAG: potassium/proton antiporter [Candidatus Nanopelagicales bacterium]